jgi:DNA processing protein
MSEPVLTERRVAAAALALLPHITPARLHALFTTFGGPEAALLAVRRGRAGAALRGDPSRACVLASEWASHVDPACTKQLLERRRTHVWVYDEPDAPILDPIPGRPPVLFGEGELDDAFLAPRVAIVGTRSATPHGLADARELAAQLAASGATIVSGLALGIDGAAHAGALDAGGLTIGVMATGLDVIYPARHRALAAAVRLRGAIVSEHAFGVAPHASQFPVRNRIIAALCDACVVVEAKEYGGASITARLAAEYGRQVFALPGSRRNPAAAGCNALIKDGAQVLLGPDDVLAELGRGRGGAMWDTPPAPPVDADEAAVIDALGGEPAGDDQLLQRSGLTLGRVASACRRLQEAGRVERRRGRWWPM